MPEERTKRKKEGNEWLRKRWGVGYRNTQVTFAVCARYSKQNIEYVPLLQSWNSPLIFCCLFSFHLSFALSHPHSPPLFLSRSHTTLWSVNVCLLLCECFWTCLSIYICACFKVSVLQYASVYMCMYTVNANDVCVLHIKWVKGGRTCLPPCDCMKGR